MLVFPAWAQEQRLGACSEHPHCLISYSGQIFPGYWNRGWSCYQGRDHTISAALKTFQGLLTSLNEVLSHRSLSLGELLWSSASGVAVSLLKPSLFFHVTSWPWLECESPPASIKEQMWPKKWEAAGDGDGIFIALSLIKQLLTLFSLWGGRRVSQRQVSARSACWDTLLAKPSVMSWPCHSTQQCNLSQGLLLIHLNAVKDPEAESWARYLKNNVVTVRQGITSREDAAALDLETSLRP